MMPPHVLVFSEAAEGLFTEVLPWTLLGLAIVVAGALVLIAVRRFMQHDGGDTDSHAFTLNALRRMHAEGKLSDEEFQSAKAAMIGRIRNSGEDATEQADTGRTAASDAAPQPENRHTPMKDSRSESDVPDKTGNDAHDDDDAHGPAGDRSAS